MYKVYIKIDNNNNINDVASTAFKSEEELIQKQYIKIDEGEDGYIYGHAQPNYLKELYGKRTIGSYGLPNFKYVDNQIIELTEEERLALLPKPQATETEKQFADIYLQLAVLQAQSGVPVTISITSPRYIQIKKYYDLGLYTEENLELFVQIGWISEEEKQQIIQKQ